MWRLGSTSQWLIWENPMPSRYDDTVDQVTEPNHLFHRSPLQQELSENDKFPGPHDSTRLYFSPWVTHTQVWMKYLSWFSSIWKQNTNRKTDGQPDQMITIPPHIIYAGGQQVWLGGTILPQGPHGELSPFVHLCKTWITEGQMLLLVAYSCLC